MPDDSRLAQHREFLKDSVRMTLDFTQTAQSRKLPAPPLQKPYAADAERVALPARGTWQGLREMDVAEAIKRRYSRRHYRDDPLSSDSLAFLLWACQGIRKKSSSWSAFRTVPSAGCRHALETYVLALNVSDVTPGVYRYLPIEHELLRLRHDAELRPQVEQATLGQSFVAEAGAVVVWTAVPERMEWRYSLAAHKLIAIDAGHACQNLYLAAVAAGIGTCAVAAYQQAEMDRLVAVDGTDEFVIYLAAVGCV